MHGFHNRERLSMFFGPGRRGHFGNRHSHGDRAQGPDGSGPLGRILGHGDLKFVILALLDEKASYGYELIKALEEKSSGQYTPSPGVIYPTLTFLEESGYATSTSENNKKLFTITPEGRELLKQNQDLVVSIFEKLKFVGEKLSKVRDWFGREDGHHRMDKESKHYLKSMFHQLKAELFAKMPISKERQAQIAEIIERAVKEIRDLK